MADYRTSSNYSFNVEIEDPPESIKTPWKLWKDKRDALHKIEEKFDTEHMIRSYKWDQELLHSFSSDFLSGGFIKNNEQSILNYLNYNQKAYGKYTAKEMPYTENTQIFVEEGNLAKYAKAEPEESILQESAKEEPSENFKNVETKLKGMGKESESKEDYLRTIYNLLEDNNKKQLKSIEIVKFMKVSKPSVSEMLKKLKKEKLVNFKKYNKVGLTKKGTRKAADIAYKHRIIELFLKEVLKVKKSISHKEAHKLEHAFSNNSIKKLEVLLNKIKNK